MIANALTFNPTQKKRKSTLVKKKMLTEKCSIINKKCTQ